MTVRDRFGRPVDLAALAALPFGQARTRLPHPPARRGYAMAPGTGPAGETCGSCRHAYRREAGLKSVTKCARSRHQGGSIASDIVRTSPACLLWEPAR